MSTETVNVVPETDEGRQRFWLKLAQDSYSGAANYFDTAVRSRIIQDIRQFQSEHPEGSKYYTDAYRLKSKLFRPKTRATIRKNEATAAAAFFSTQDVVSIQPINDNNPMHRAAAVFHKSLLQHRLTKPEPHGMPWFLTCLGAYQAAESVGICISYQEWLADEDRPESKLVPIENCKFDPAADWRNPVKSSPYLIIQWPLYVTEVKQRCAKGTWLPCSEAEILSAAKNSADTIRLTREGKGVDSLESGGPVTDYSIVWIHENLIRVSGVDVTYFTLGTQKLLTMPELVEDKHPQGRPVTIGFTILEAHKAYKPSIGTLTREVQAEINDVANERRHAVRLANDKRYIVERNKAVDLRSLTRNIPASVTLADDVNAIKVVTTDDATASAYQEQDRLNLDFDDLAGVFSGSSVASNRKLNETVGGMNLLSVSANMVTEYSLRVFTKTWVEPTLRQIILLEQRYETNPEVLAMAAEKASTELGKQQVMAQQLLEFAEQLIVQDVLLKVDVGVGAANPVNQLEKFVYGLSKLAEIMPTQLQRLKPDEVIKELFGKLGYEDGLRFFSQEGENEDPRLAQLQQVIQELQAKLAQKEDPALTAAKVEKTQAETTLLGRKAELTDVEAVVKRMEALYSSMQTALAALSTPGAMPVADEISLSAGFVDQNAPPIYPADYPAPLVQQNGEQVITENTSPLSPAHPQSGMMSGIEGGGQ